MKRIFTALTGALLISSLAVTVCAEGLSEDNDWLYGTYEDGTAVISSGAPAVFRNNGNIVIPSEIDGYTVAEIGWYCFTGETGLFSVEIPETVGVVGHYAFENCYGLNTVNFDSNAAAAGTEYIGEGAFINCYGLYQVNLPAGLKFIGDKAFSNCTAMSTINIPHGVEHIGSEAFADCTALQAVSIPVTVTELGDDIFDGCTSMLTVYYAGTGAEWDKITKDENDFRDVSVIFASEETDPVADVPVELPDYMPYGEYDGFIYKIMNDGTAAIDGYTGNAAEIIIPSEIEGCPVTTISDSVFEYCDFIVEVTIPDSVVAIREYAFRGCENIESVTMGKNVTEIGEYAFSGCESLIRMEIPEGVTVIENNLFRNCSDLTEIVIPKNVTEIGYAAFDRCYDLEKVYYGGSKDDWKAVSVGAENDYLEDSGMVYNYDAETYKPAGAAVAIILCSLCVLILVIVIIAVASRKKPVCPECGAELDEGSKFCGGCGREL